MTTGKVRALHTTFLLGFGGLLLFGFTIVPIWPSLAPAYDLVFGPLMAVPGATSLVLVPAILPAGLADLSTVLAVLVGGCCVGVFLLAGWKIAQYLTGRRAWVFLAAVVGLACLNVLLGSYALQAAAAEGWGRLAGIVPEFPQAASIASIGLLLNGLFYSGWWLFGRGTAR